ncbi:transcription factor bHLH30-like [Phragmites australis]|uniref:transcription factor bHLH30-like n=1 Tax=Phragmites australis TaxID=29695 RepID=UPI002D78E38F|nr:transcription factor bHLH30-like [Phragmites australis]
MPHPIQKLALERPAAEASISLALERTPQTLAAPSNRSMGGHSDHHHQEVGVLVDEEEEELEQQARACDGATSGVVERGVGDGGGQEAAGMVFEASSSVGSVSATMAPSQILCWPSPPQQHPHGAIHHSHNIGGSQTPFFPLLPPLPPQPPLPPPFFADFYARRALQFAYDHHSGGTSSSSDPLGLGGLYLGHHGGSPVPGMMMPPPFASSPFGDFGRMTAQEIMDAKALAASKSHSEAERRRRERINTHLARLRSLLPNTTKTDKASLLAEVIQHVKELKRQTSEITEEACPLPTESDELTVDASSDEDGRLVVRASICCDDRADLLPDLIRALKALRLRALKAEITTLGGRVKNVLVVTGDDSAGCPGTDGDQQQQQEEAPMSPHHTVASIQDALRAVMERTASSAAEESGGAASSGAGLKRQRTTSLAVILENRSI